MPEFVTIWDTNTAAPAVLETVVNWTNEDPEHPVPITESRTLARVPWSEGQWSRPALANNLAARLDPHGHGCTDFPPSWIILLVEDVVPPLGVGEVLSADHDGGVADLEAGTIVYTWTVERMSEVPFKAAWATERDRLISKIKADAEAASMAFLTPGTAKAQKYTAKKSEAERWPTESSPRDLSTYPFALREAAALAGLDPFDADDLAEVSEGDVEAVIAVYIAASTAYVAIGSGIEALEQKATADITAAHDDAMAAYDLNSDGDVSGVLAAMRAAAAPSFPTP